MNIFNININYFILPFAATVLYGCGKGDIDPISQSTLETTQDDFQAADFVAPEELKMQPVGPTGLLPEIVLPAGTEVSVIETKVDPQHGTLVRIGIDTEEGSSLPSDAWVILGAGLIGGLVRADSLESDEEEAGEEVIDDPEADPEGALDGGADLGSEADLDAEGELTETARVRKKMTYCYRYVKRYLLSIGKVKTYLPGTSAWEAAKILPKYGFRKTGHTPKTAKEGEVCVYSGGPKGHGHIEVKRNGKWWYGYGFLPQPIKNRKFIACYAK